MSNLTLRILTAVVAVPILIVTILWQNPLGLATVVFAAVGAALFEFFGMTLGSVEAPVRERERWTGIFLGVGFSTVLYFWPQFLFEAIAVVTLAAFVFYMFAFAPIQSVAGRLNAMLAGILYCSLLTCLAILKRGEKGTEWVFVTLTVTWFSDTGAYFAGRFLGPLWPARLYPALSPKKTVMGLFGGLLASLGALVLAKFWYLPTLTWMDCGLIAFPAGLLGVAGDLCESMIKRSVGVKDSGKLLPGHGGILDRIDALLFVVAYVFIYVRWCQ